MGGRMTMWKKFFFLRFNVHFIHHELEMGKIFHYQMTMLFFTFLSFFFLIVNVEGKKYWEKSH